MIPRRHPQVTPVLEQLAFEINAELDGVVKGVRATVHSAINAGKLLIKAKEEVRERGKRWLDWLREKCPRLSIRQAQKYMRVANYAAECEARECSIDGILGITENGNTSSTTHLGIDAVLSLLRVPRAEQPEADNDDQEGEAEADDRADEDDQEGDDDQEGEYQGDEVDGYEEDGDDAEEDGAAETSNARTEDIRMREGWIRARVLKADQAASMATLRSDWTRRVDLMDDAFEAAYRKAALAWVGSWRAIRRLRRQPPQQQQAAE